MAYVQFYREDPAAPKPNRPVHLGANVLITCDDKLLLEKRADCDIWGLVGGGVKDHETSLQGIVREVYEELGLRVSPKAFVKEKVYGEPGRIAAFKDGSIWAMVIVAYTLQLDSMPQMWISKESKDLRFFSRDEIKNIDIVVTHSDIVDELFLNK
jgi:8-oxo-dGTP pyrophosphatase MutT (NUDIX family)